MRIKLFIGKFLSPGMGVLLFLFILFLLVFEIYACFLQYFEGSKKLPPLSGNFLHVREVLTQEKSKEEFRFAVIGDTKSTGTFEKIADKLKEESLSFVVLLGDFVRRGTEGEHTYFKAELSGEFAFPFPTFFLAGNHDVDVNTFPISRFEEVYGPSIFSFVYQECLFIFLRILDKPNSTKESLQFLEKCISENASSKYRKIFVLSHIPPPISQDFDVREFKGSKKFVSLIEKLQADYVITGDYHGYARVKKGNTVYLVTGGGGAHLEKSKYGCFHHAMVITVSKDNVSEQILFVNRNEDLEDRIERFILADMYPWFRNHFIIVSLLNSMLFVCCIIIFRKIKNNRTRSILWLKIWYWQSPGLANNTAYSDLIGVILRFLGLLATRSSQHGFLCNGLLRKRKSKA